MTHDHVDVAEDEQAHEFRHDQRDTEAMDVEGPNHPVEVDESVPGNHERVDQGSVAVPAIDHGGGHIREVLGTE